MSHKKILIFPLMFFAPFMIYVIIGTVKKQFTFVGGGGASGKVGLNPSKCFFGTSLIDV